MGGCARGAAALRDRSCAEELEAAHKVAALLRGYARSGEIEAADKARLKQQQEEHAAAVKASPNPNPSTRISRRLKIHEQIVSE